MDHPHYLKVQQMFWYRSLFLLKITIIVKIPFKFHLHLENHVLTSIRTNEIDPVFISVSNNYVIHVQKVVLMYSNLTLLNRLVFNGLSQNRCF